MLPASAPQEKKSGLAYWANRVLEECDKASAGFAADPVHDLRVAIRRCRSMADGFLSVDPDPAWKQMKRLAKPLFSSLGDLRDTQVMLEWVAKLAHADDPVSTSLSAALTQKEADLKVAAMHSLAGFDRKEWSALNAHLATRTDKVPPEGEVFQHLALERWTEARELHRRALRNRSSVGYHQLRIGIKRFRYTVENFMPQRHSQWSKGLRDLQDALGEVHDLDVLRAMIQAHPDLPHAERLRWQQRIAEERQKRLDLYRSKMMGSHSLWQVWRAQLPGGPLLEQAAMEKLRTWASFLDPDIPHSARVTRLALDLYDGVCQCGVLTASSDLRRILEAAAMLHSVGRDANTDGHGGGHRKLGYKAVAKLSPPLGWSAEDILSVAILVRYHRGALRLDRNSPFVGLTSKRRIQLMPVLGVLRLANAFDQAHDESISSIRVECQDGAMVVYAEGLQRMSCNAEKIAGARYLLEAISRRPIVVRPLPAARSTAGVPKSRRKAAATS